jgi:hypothetical protein
MLIAVPCRDMWIILAYSRRLVHPIRGGLWRLLLWVGVAVVVARAHTHGVARVVRVGVLWEVLLLLLRHKRNSHRVWRLEGREGLGGQSKHLVLLLLGVDGGPTVTVQMMLIYVGYKVSGLAKAKVNSWLIERRIWIGGGVMGRVGSAIRAGICRGGIPGFIMSCFVIPLVSIANSGRGIQLARMGRRWR